MKLCSSKHNITDVDNNYEPRGVILLTNVPYNYNIIHSFLTFAFPFSVWYIPDARNITYIFFHLFLYPSLSCKKPSISGTLSADVKYSCTRILRALSALCLLSLPIIVLVNSDGKYFYKWLKHFNTNVPRSTCSL